MNERELTLTPLPADTSGMRPPVGGFRDGDLKDRLFAAFPLKEKTAGYFWEHLTDAEIRACFVAADHDTRTVAVRVGMETSTVPLPYMGKLYDYLCGTTMAKHHGLERGRDRAPMEIPERVMVWDDAKKAEYRAWKTVQKAMWDAEKEAGQAP